MNITATHAGASAKEISRPDASTASDPILQRLIELKKPTRKFFTALFGRSGKVDAEDLQAAKLVHANIVLNASSKSASFNMKAFYSTYVKSVFDRGSGGVFELAQRSAASDAKLRALMASMPDPTTFVSELAKEIRAARGTSASEAEKLAGVIYTAMMAKVAQARQTEAAASLGPLEARFDAIKTSIEMPFENDRKSAAAEHYEALRQLWADLAADPSVGTRKAVLAHKIAALAETRFRADLAGGLLDRIASIRSRLSFTTSADEFRLAREQLADCSGMLKAIQNFAVTSKRESLKKELANAQAPQILAAADEALEYATILESRKADLEALGGEMAALRASPTRDEASPCELDKALAQVKTPEKYVACKRALDATLRTVSSMSRGETLERLGMWIRPDHKGRDDTYLLPLIHGGDKDIIDMVFFGAEWHADAKALKTVALDTLYGEKFAAIDPEDKDAAAKRTRLNDERTEAMARLEAQHTRRVLAFELDFILQQANANDKVMSFSQSLWKPKVELPGNVFKSTKADPTLMAWLLKAAKGAGVKIEHVDALLANWILLSNYDAATGRVDQAAANAAVKTLQGAQGKKYLQIPGAEDPETLLANIAKLVGQGFRSSAQVRKCSEQLHRFTSAMARNTDLVLATERELFLHVKAEKLVQGMVQKATGRAVVFEPTRIAEAVGEVVGQHVLLNRPGEFNAAKRSTASKMKSGLTTVVSRGAQAVGIAPKTTQGAAQKRGHLLDALTTDAAKSEVHHLAQWRGDDKVNLWFSDFLDDPARLRARGDTIRKVLDLARVQVELTSTQPVPTRERKLELNGLKSRLVEQLAGVNLATFEMVKDATNLINPADLCVVNTRGIPAVKPSLIDLATLLRHDDEEATLSMHGGNADREARKMEEDLKPLLHIAILERVAANQGKEWSWDDQIPAIQARLRDFGFAASGENAPRLAFMSTYFATKLAEYAKDKKSPKEMCEDWGQDFKADAIKAVKAARAAVLGGDVDEIEKDRQERQLFVTRRIDEVQPGQSMSVNFGEFGNLNASAPIPVFGLGGAIESRKERSDGIVIARPSEGRYQVTIVKGTATVNSLSVGFLSDLLNLQGAATQSSSKSHTFNFETKDDCLAFAKALVNGDASNPALWGLEVDRTRASASQVSAQLGAQADLSVASLSAAISAEGGHSVERTSSGGLEIESVQAERTYKAEAAAELAADLGKADAEVGSHLSVRKTLVKNFGAFTDASEVLVGSRVIGDGLDRALKNVLPKSQWSQIDDWKARIGDVPEGQELTVAVQFKLKKDAEKEARGLVLSAQRDIAQITAGTNDAPKLRAEAQEKVRKAYALTRKNESYEAAALQWTRTAKAEVEQNRQVLTRFARGETSQQDSIAFANRWDMGRVDLP